GSQYGSVNVTSVCALLRIIRSCRRSFLSRIVPAFGAHRELAVPLGLGVNADRAIPARAFWIRGLVAKRVLVATVVCHVAADRIHSTQVLREESRPARFLRDELQRLPCPPRFLFAQ